MHLPASTARSTPHAQAALARVVALILATVLATLLAACSSTPQSTSTPPPSTAFSASPTTGLAPSPSGVAPTTPTGTAGATDSPIPPLPTEPPPSGPLATPPTQGTPTPGGPLADGLAGDLQAALERARDLRGVPGIAAAVIFPDGSRWAGASGSAALDPRVAATPDTPYVVGSITKTFVAALSLQLAEEGVLDLDGTLDRWLPDFPRATQITLRQLLNHTSGVFNYFEHPDYNRIVFGQPDRKWQPQEILDDFGGPPYFAPGTGWHYSNTGFVLLGMVIEKATGSTLGDEFQNRFLTPLGLADSYFQSHGTPPEGAAQGHLRRPAGLQEVSDGTSYRPTKSAATVAWAAGGMVLSADDLATWCDALYGGDLFSPDSLAQMTDYSLPGALNYGLGTRTRVLDGHRMFGHTGSLRGFMAVMWHFPDADLTVVLLNNLGRINPNPMVDSLSSLALPAALAYRPGSASLSSSTAMSLSLP